MHAVLNCCLPENDAFLFTPFGNQILETLRYLTAGLDSLADRIKLVPVAHILARCKHASPTVHLSVIVEDVINNFKWLTG